MASSTMASSTMASSTMASSTMASSTFHPFTNLPFELRLKIYNLALPTTRLVPMKYFSPTILPRTHLRVKPFRGCTSTAVIPSLLHVSHEARTLAAAHYKLSFNLAGPPGSFAARVWFDSSCDILFFDQIDGQSLLGYKNFLHCLTVVDRKELGKVKKLAVHVGVFVNSCGSEVVESRREKSAATSSAEFRRLRDFWEYVKTKFNGLEEVLFIYPGGEKDALSKLERGWVDEAEEMEEQEDGFAWIVRDGEKDLFSLAYDESFAETANRAAMMVQKQGEREGQERWVVPRWCVLEESRNGQMMDIDVGNVEDT